MAVAGVYGRVDGVKVALEPAQGNFWSVPVPLDQDGEYAVEIIAEDEAENRTYLAKMIYTVDASMLCVHVLPVPYYTELLADQYTAELIEPCGCRRGG